MIIYFVFRYAEDTYSMYTCILSTEILQEPQQQELHV